MVKRRTHPENDAAQADLFGAAPEASDVATSTVATSEPDAAAAALHTPAARALGDAALARQFAAIPDAWRQALDAFIGSPTCARLCAFVDGERAAGKTIYPAQPFRALQLTPAADVKVVILGQDPYHGEENGIPQAHGLAFSVPPGVRPPPSLRNICKEISAEFGFGPPPHGCLDHWAKQGVLLLNTVLTVERDKAASHAKHGWEACTDALIAHLGQQRQGIVFLLWGAHAQAKRALLAQHAHHQVLEAPHPSPLSAHRGFLGCGHFAQANAALEASGRTAIDWRIPPV